MNDLRHEIQMQYQRKSLKKRLPLTVLIIASFLLYTLWQPLAIFKWASVGILIVYIGIGLYYRRKLKTELDNLHDESNKDDSQQDTDIE
jgi:amino acid transporter